MHEEERHQSFRDLIKAERLGMGLQAEAALDEAGEEIAGHRAKSNACSDAPLETQNQRQDRRRAKRGNHPANSFGEAENRLSVGQPAPAIQRSGEASLEQPSREDWAAVGNAKQK